MTQPLTVEEAVRRFIPDATEECIQDVILHAPFKISKRYKKPCVTRPVIFEYLRALHNLPITHYSKGQKNYWILRGYSDEEAEEKYLQYSKQYFARTVESTMKRYGVDRQTAERMRAESMEKTRQTVSQWSDEKRREVGRQKSQALDALIERYGEEEGTRRYQQRLRRYKKTISDNWNTLVNEHGLEYALQKRKEKSSDLAHCIARYGEEEGRRRYKETSRKKSFAQTLDGYISRYGEEEGTRRYNERQEKYVNTFRQKPIEELTRINKSKHVKFLRASKPSLKVFEPLHQWLLERGFSDNDIFYGVGTRQEFCLYSQDRQYFWYDFTIQSLKVVIEFNGVTYHPKSPDQPDFEHPFEPTRTAKVVWDHDQLKLDVAQKAGYNVFVVWEDVLPEENLKYLQSEISKLMEQ